MTVLPVSEDIPDFDGKAVYSAAVKIVGALDLADMVVRMDDDLCLFVKLRCVNVAHGVDARGDLKRVQTLKILDAEVTHG